RLTAYPCGEICGVEAVAGRRRVDRHYDLRHRHELARAGIEHQRALGAVLYRDLADAERLEPFDRCVGACLAPSPRLIVERGERDVDALERLHEYGSSAGEIALPAARPEVTVECDLHAVLARKLDEREKAADAHVRIERERDAGEIDQAAS